LNLKEGVFMRLLSLLVALLFSQVLLAADLAMTVGTRQNSVSAASVGALDKSGMGYQFGGLAFIPMTDALSVRTGFIYAKRNFTLTVAGVTSDYDFNYFDIPMTALFRFSDFGGVFAGVVFGLNLTDDCTLSTGASCSANGVNTTVTPLTVGASFKFAPQLGGEIYLETGGELSSDAKSYRAVGASLLVTFE
jgi:hypothetical protein